MSAGRENWFVSRARARGRLNLPASSESSIDDAQTEIVERIESEHRALADECAKAAHRDAARFTSIADQLDGPAELTVEVEQTMAQIEEHLAQDQSLAGLHRQALECTRDLRALMDRHGVDREARYPGSYPLHFGLVALVGTVELLANTIYFAPTSESGATGGFLQALVVTGCNLAIGLGTGYFGLRELVAGVGARRVLAGLGAAAATLAAVAFNVATAHFRDLATLAEVAPGTVLRETFHDPLGLSYNSLTLLALGILTFAFAVWKGYESDDPLAGYGPSHRRLIAARGAFCGGIEDLLGRMLGELEDLRRTCRSTVNRATGDIEELGELLASVRGHNGRYERGRADLESDRTTMLRDYRCTNVRVRTTPAPSYFGSYPDLPSLLDDSILPDLAARLARAREGFEALRVERDRIERQSTMRVAFVRARFAAHMREQVFGNGDLAHVTNFSNSGSLALLASPGGAS